MPEILILLFIVSMVFIIILVSMYYSSKKKISELEAQIHNRAQSQYQRWREKEFESLRIEQRSIARREAVTELDQWKIEYEAFIRQDAIERSRAVIVGKVTEHLVPHMPIFPYNPKDARFIGSPVDLIVFDGADEGMVRDVIFLEIKTGSSALSVRQKQIRDAVEAGRVLWRVLKL